MVVVVVVVFVVMEEGVCKGLGGAVFAYPPTPSSPKGATATPPTLMTS